VTNSLGEYVVTNLPLGSYRVEVEVPGFMKSVQSPIEVQIKSRARADFTLRVGEVSQSIEVTGAAPLIQTDTPEVGNSLPQKALNSLPIISRGLLEWVALVPGTTSGAV